MINPPLSLLSVSTLVSTFFIYPMVICRGIWHNNLISVRFASRDDLSRTGVVAGGLSLFRNGCKNMDTIWRLLPRLYYSMRKYLFTRARECGLEKGQPRILDYVYVNDGCIQREICDEFSLDKSSISNFLAKLEEDGTLRRKRNPLSSREVNVFVTDKGREIQKRLDVVYDELEQITFQGFSPEEKEQCIHYLSRLTKNMMSYRKDESQ